MLSIGQYSLWSKIQVIYGMDGMQVCLPYSYRLSAAYDSLLVIRVSIIPATQTLSIGDLANPFHAIKEEL